MTSAILTWLFVTLSSFGAHIAVGGGGPIPKPHIANSVSGPTVGGGGPISR